jgi:hypothetical protein
MDERRAPGDIDWHHVLPPGEHHWTMGVRRVSAEAFLAPTPDGPEILAERRRWLAEDPAKYAILLPETVPALDETIERLAPVIRSGEPYARLLELGRRAEPDLIWLLPAGRDAWRVVGGVVCFPSSWDLTVKVGRPMDEVHGPVPNLNASLGSRIDAFLTGFDAGFGWGRVNWSLTRDADRNYHPTRGKCRLDEHTRPEAVRLRLEHQLLVRLPESRAVLFALRIETRPLAEVKADATVAARLADALETMSPEIAKYKNFAASRERLIAYLRGS